MLCYAEGLGLLTEDPIIVGAVAGIIGNIPKTILAWLFYAYGYLRYTFIHIAAGSFVSVEFVEDTISLAIGSIADFTMAAFLGFIMNLMLKKYGNDFAVLKGMGFGTFLYIILYGAFMDLNITRASLLTPLPNLLLFFPHILYGGVTCWLIRRYSVFLIQARGE